jgi:cyclase
MKYVLLFVLACLSNVSFAQENFDSVKVVAQKVSDQIFMLKGAGGNIGVLIGKDGTLMVDDQFAPLANRINGAIKTLDPGEIRFLVNTHMHGDHSGGNENFKRMGVTIVAQDNVRTRMGKEVTNPTTKEVTPPRDKDAWPMVTFANTLNVHLNDEDVELIHLDPAHTDGDVAVRFVKANVYHMGDMFVTYGYPYIDYENGGSINGFISTLDKLLGMMDEKTKIIPGHGELCMKADMKTFRDKLADIRDQVSAALKKGKKPEDITGLGITDKYEAEWGKGFIKGKDFVMLVASDLKASMPAKK